MATPRRYFSELPVAMGGSDGLIMMGMFACISAIALRASVSTAATATVLISMMRTIIIPLKQYGIVAARMVKAAEPECWTPVQRMNTFFTVVLAMAAPLGLTMVIVPDLVAEVVGLPRHTGRVLLAIQLCGLQLLVEPFASFISGALKVLATPSIGVTSLAISASAIVLPIVLGAALLHQLSPAVIWLAMLAGRLFFCTQMARGYLRWRNVRGRAI